MPIYKVTVECVSFPTEMEYEVEADNVADARQSALLEAKHDHESWIPELQATDVEKQKLSKKSA